MRGRVRRVCGKAWLVAAVVGGSWLGGGCGDAGETVRIQSPSGELRLAVDVTEARTAAARMQGLRDRADLPPGAGLLLVFPVEGQVCIVNDGVSFAIDEVFVDGDGQVTAVERDVAAGDGTARCHAPAQRVLEVAAGVGSQVQSGDVVVQ